MGIVIFKKVKLIIVFMAILSFFSLSCSRKEYTIQYFAYPQNVKPHEENWEYMCTILVYSSISPVTKKSKKDIIVKIVDKNNRLLLKDRLYFVSASIRANVSWNNFKKLEVELFETGNIFAEDDYNSELVKKGPHQLIKLVYIYLDDIARFNKKKQKRNRNPL